MASAGTPQERNESPEAAHARTSERLRRLLMASRRLGSTLDPHEIYESLVGLLQESVSFDGLIVSSYDPQSREIRCQYAWVEGSRPEPADFPPLTLGPEDQGMQSRVIRTALPYLFSDVESRVRAPGTYYEVTPDGDAERMPAEAPRDKEYQCTRSAMMAPIILEGQVLGVVQLMSMQQGAYTHDDLELLEGMVLQMGAAVRNAALYSKAQREVEERTKAQAAIEELNLRLQRSMAETHHRVKNNLQILSALIDVQIMGSGELVPRSSLERLLRQVRSLSSLHDLLTQESKLHGDAQFVSARTALEKLVEIIGKTAVGRHIRVEADEVGIPIGQCTAFILLVNELISNAVKHGAGEIKVRVTLSDVRTGSEERRKHGRVRLEVLDEGPGFPPHFQPASAANTGLELIESLGRWDLNGRLAYENRDGGGARVVVTFPQTKSVETAGG